MPTVKTNTSTKTKPAQNKSVYTASVAYPDLKEHLQEHFGFNKFKAKDIMSVSPKMIEANLLAVEALEIMKTHNINQIVVMNNKEYVGILHLHDLIKEGII